MPSTRIARQFNRALAGLATSVLLLSLTAACGSGSGDDKSAGQTPQGKVELTFWSWAPDIDKVVEKWNSTHPNIHVTVSKQAQGDDLLTKVLTSNKAGNPPDLIQAEYQALPTLVSNGVLADIGKEAGAARAKFADGVWQQVTVGSDAVYAIPQDTGPMMLFYRTDLFKKYDLKVPATWDEFAQTARAVRTKDPKKFLTTFSANDPGWFAGLAQQAGASWWSVSGDAWKVSVNDAATKKVADFWGGLVKEGAIDDQPMYTPEWNKELNDGTLIAWPSAVWAPGVLEGVAAKTKGKWAMAPLPQWTAGEQRTGSWGGSSTGVAAKSKNKAAAAQFAVWLNTDPTATEALVTESGIYPAASDAQSGQALQKAPTFMPGQADFYQQAKAIAANTAGFTWGPTVNITYSTYKDAFTKAVQQKTAFGAVIDQMQQATVADMQKNGFKVAG
jgi:multiple sugar transport system substrate-binding protein